MDHHKLLDRLPAAGQRPAELGLRVARAVDWRLGLLAARREDERRRPAANTQIDPHGDEMFVYTEPSHYFSVGRSALAAVRAGLSRAGVTEVDRILDMACGHGRVLRMLAAQWPRAEITACDINRDGVDFCARTFGARPVYSANPIGDVDPGAGYDLVWVGSLLTHLPEQRWPEMLGWFRDRLRPGGAVLFSTHGEGAIDRSVNGYDYAVSMDEMIGRYRSEGFGYEDYRHQPGYGISLSGTSWIKAKVAEVGGLRVISTAERGWDGHQDVTTCVADAALRAGTTMTRWPARARPTGSGSRA